MSSIRRFTVHFITGFLFALIFSKFVFTFVMFLQDGGRVIAGAFNYFKSILFRDDTHEIRHTFLPERRQFITTAGTFLSGSLFLSMLYGITKGKYKYVVENVQLEFDDLPEAFDGIKCQIFISPSWLWIFKFSG